MTLDRRQFVGAAAAGVATMLVGAGRVDRAAPSDALDLARPALLAALGPEAIRDIGRAYRALVPDESDRATLERAVRDALLASRMAGEDALRADFSAGRVVVVHGWMLSRTEARQCALYSILA